MNVKYKILENSKYVALFVSTLYPVVTSAQVCSSYSGAGVTVCNVIDVANVTLNAINPILAALCFVVFFWGLSKFILNSGSKDEIEKGKNYMIWAIAALFILISFRAIISFITSDLGFGPGTATPQIPQA